MYPYLTTTLMSTNFSQPSPGRHRKLFTEQSREISREGTLSSVKTEVPRYCPTFSDLSFVLKKFNRLHIKKVEELALS